MVLYNETKDYKELSKQKKSACSQKEVVHKKTIILLAPFTTQSVSWGKCNVIWTKTSFFAINENLGIAQTWLFHI